MRLMRREKRMLAGLAIFFLVLGVVAFVIIPAQERRDKLDGMIKKKERGFQRIVALRDEWQRVSKIRNRVLNQIQSRGKDFAIFSYMEILAAESGLKEAIQYMRPLSLSQDDVQEGFIKKGIEIRLKGVEIDKMVNYLYRIEYSDKMMKIESIHLKPVYTEPQFINATFRVVTYELS